MLLAVYRKVLVFFGDDLEGFEVVGTDEVVMEGAGGMKDFFAFRKIALWIQAKQYLHPNAAFAIAHFTRLFASIRRQLLHLTNDLFEHLVDEVNFRDEIHARYVHPSRSINLFHRPFFRRTILAPTPRPASST
jgi:hypothetical protein